MANKKLQISKLLYFIMVTILLAACQNANILSSTHEVTNRVAISSTSTTAENTEIPPTSTQKILTPTPSELPPTPTLTQYPKNLIAFWTNRSGNWEIYLMNEDGSKQTSLIQDVTYTYYPPAWSPDGSKIAYISSFASGSSLMVIDVFTGETHLLANNYPIIDPPVWSPDGSRIAFTFDTDTDSGEIYLINSNGTGLINLSNNPNVDWRPAWSPDGSKIIYQSMVDDQWELIISDISGVEQKNVTQSLDIWGTRPTWSPTNDQIAFHNGSGSQGEVYVINTDGSRLINVSDHTADDSPAVWSPDGSTLLFYSDRDGDNDLFSVHPDGSDLMNITQNIEPDWAPSWSTDGNRILFVSGNGDQWDIYSISKDGQERLQLTSGESDETYPAWQP